MLARKNIFLIGYMGSGKSSIGRPLAELLHLSFIDLDELIEQTQGSSVSELFAAHGEQAFREMESRALRKLIKSDNKYVVSCGGGTPCYGQNMLEMNQNGLTVFLNVPLDELLIRLQKDFLKRPLLAEMNPEERQAYIDSHLKSRMSFYQQAHVSLEGANIQPDQVYQALLNSLKS